MAKEMEVQQRGEDMSDPESYTVVPKQPKGKSK